MEESFLKEEKIRVVGTGIESRKDLLNSPLLRYE
jgi:hypothetical protein